LAESSLKRHLVKTSWTTSVSQWNFTLMKALWTRSKKLNQVWRKSSEH